MLILFHILITNLSFFHNVQKTKISKEKLIYTKESSSTTKNNIAKNIMEILCPFSTKSSLSLVNLSIRKKNLEKKVTKLIIA